LITDFRDLKIKIKFVDSGERTNWVVSECNRVFNCGETIFSQLGTHTQDCTCGGVLTTFKEVDMTDIDLKGRNITQFSCGRYHTCLAIDDMEAFGVGYSSFFQTVSLLTTIHVTGTIRDLMQLEMPIDLRDLISMSEGSLRIPLYMV